MHGQCMNNRDLAERSPAMARLSGRYREHDWRSECILMLYVLLGPLDDGLAHSNLLHSGLSGLPCVAFGLIRTMCIFFSLDSLQP